MTNKEYRTARERAEQAVELATYEHWNGYSWRPSYYMTGDDLRAMRAERKRAEQTDGARTIDTRSSIRPLDGVPGWVLTSYYTDVAAIIDGTFYRLWDGFSVTTLKHVNTFRAMYGMDALKKRDWIAAPIVVDVVDEETGELLLAA